MGDERPKKGPVTLPVKWFWIALPIVLFFGYIVGKDMALRDNARDAAVEAAR